jgi:alpha-L-fucosidase
MPALTNQDTASNFVPAGSIIHAQKFASQSGGVKIVSTAPDLDAIEGTAVHDWVGFSKVDFGDGQFNLCMIYLSTQVYGSSIAIRLDAPDGPCIGTLDAEPTGADGAFKEQYAQVEPASGIHDVYLVFSNACIAVDWFIFSVDPDRETQSQRDQRMRWWREARFGQFIHWGPYAALGRGEWAMYIEQWRRADYQDQVISRFPVTDASAKEWVRAAKSAGQGYIVFTAKHHDGFCMFETRTQNSISAHRLAGADPLRALSRACKEWGIRFCVYYSILDWSHPSQTPVYDGSGLTIMEAGWKDRYISEMKEQLRELVENYDPDLLWFDGDWGGDGWWWTEADGAALYRYLRALKPGLIINERVKRDSGLGDFRSPEQVIPPSGLPYDWETCMTMNESWGFHAGDDRWKPVDVLLKDLIDVASKGGNFLLNIGPMPDGSVPQQSLERLSTIGAWIAANGESIFGTSASPFPKIPAWGRCTKRPGRLYLHVFTRPDDGVLRLPVIQNEIGQIYWLDGSRSPLKSWIEGGELAIELTSGMPDTIVPVICIDVTGLPTGTQEP